MASFIESQLRNAIAAGFKGKLLIGELTRTVSAGLDQYGDPVAGVEQTFRVEGFCDDWTSLYKAQAGIPEDDSKVVLILGNCQTTPIKDDKIVFPNFPTFQIRKVIIDPARATAECQSFKV